MEHRAGFEPAALQFCRLFLWTTQAPMHYLERDIRIELITGPWQGSVLPIN